MMVRYQSWFDLPSQKPSRKLIALGLVEMKLLQINNKKKLVSYVRSHISWREEQNISTMVWKNGLKL